MEAQSKPILSPNNFTIQLIRTGSLFDFTA
jgi:hypothetical protein